MIEKRIEWTTASGKDAAITIVFRTEETVDADGDRCDVPACKIRINAEVAGMEIIGMPISRKPVNAGGANYPATIGGLVIPTDVLGQIDAVLAEIHATPQWQAQENAAAAGRKASAGYEKHRAFMRKQMGY